MAFCLVSLEKEASDRSGWFFFANYWITEPWYWRQARRARIFEKIRMDRHYPSPV
jgi:hypothetical protein